MFQLKVDSLNNNRTKEDHTANELQLARNLGQLIHKEAHHHTPKQPRWVTRNRSKYSPSKTATKTSTSIVVNKARDNYLIQKVTCFKRNKTNSNHSRLRTISNQRALNLLKARELLLRSATNSKQQAKTSW